MRRSFGFLMGLLLLMMFATPAFAADNGAKSQSIFEMFFLSNDTLGL